MKGFNSLLGSHYDHYYLMYDSYSIDDIDPQVFQVENGKYLFFANLNKSAKLKIF